MEKNPGMFSSKT